MFFLSKNCHVFTVGVNYDPVNFVWSYQNLGTQNIVLFILCRFSFKHGDVYSSDKIKLSRYTYLDSKTKTNIQYPRPMLT